jgi:hypothetical protein
MPLKNAQRTVFFKIRCRSTFYCPAKALAVWNSPAPSTATPTPYTNPRPNLSPTSTRGAAPGRPRRNLAPCSRLLSRRLIFRGFLAAEYDDPQKQDRQHRTSDSND